MPHYFLTFFFKFTKPYKKDTGSAHRLLISFLQCAGVNAAGCRIAREVASEGDALVAGGLSQCPTYLNGGSKAAVQAEFKIQLDEFVKNKVDFLICEVSCFFLTLYILGKINTKLSL